MKPRLPLLSVSIVGLSLLLWALSAGLAPAAVSAAPAGGITKVFLPVIVKPPPPIYVSPFQLAANVGPNCIEYPWDFSGLTSLVATGQVTQIYFRVDFDHVLGKSYRVDWYMNNAFWYTQSGTFDADAGYFHYPYYSSNGYPCTGQIAKRAYRVDLYVEDVLRQSGTISVQ